MITVLHSVDVRKGFLVTGARVACFSNLRYRVLVLQVSSPKSTSTGGCSPSNGVVYGFDLFVGLRSFYFLD